MSKPDIYFSLTPNTATVKFQDLIRTWNKDDDDFKDVLELHRNGDVDGIIDLLKNQVELKEAAAKSNGLYEFKDGHIFVDGKAVPPVLAERILAADDNNLSDVVAGLTNFYRRLKMNPSNDSVNRLFACLDTNHHPITPDGFFKAYKRVRRKDDKLVDIYTGSVDNSVGTSPRVERNEVNDDHSVTCSYGLHVASYNYAARHYGRLGDPLVEVLVDPADVVSVPFDYNNQKMRVCGYKVVKEVTEEDFRGFAPELGGLYERPIEDVEGTTEEEVEYSDDFIDEIFEEGELAYELGESRHANPYFLDEILDDVWNEGWLHARDNDSNS